MINQGLKGKFEWLNDRPLYASISGGKDSTALGVHLQKNGIKFTPLFIDTGWEHHSTYEYIQDVLVPLFGEFTVLRNERYFQDDSEWKGGMEQVIKHNRMFPSGFAKFCTRLLKIVPVQNFYAEIRLQTKKKPINAVGVRAEESRKRSEMPKIEEQDEATVWRPLIEWTETEIIDLHSKHTIPPNPLYLKGASRVGCYPCIYARKHEIRNMSFADPNRIAYIEELEQRVNEKLRRKDEPQATFFKSRHKNKIPMGIREIVKWSRYDRKRGYLEDQEEIEHQGCMRWGFCEPPLSDQLAFDFGGLSARRST
jgi:3'-phosphoadenosine 5'-phosphosulfate sulfotransferase (PAPS reductase)/FAD synthetase